MEADTTEQFTEAMQSLTSEKSCRNVGISSYVSSLYGFKTSDINEARYKSFLRMSGGKDKNPLARIKKINCASLPPCAKSMGNHIKRAHFIAMIWKRADQMDPTNRMRPVDYGWRELQNGLEPDWFPGHPVPESLTQPLDREEVAGSVSPEDEDSDSPWSDDSEDEL